MPILYVIFIKDLLTSDLTVKAETCKAMGETIFDTSYDEIIVRFIYTAVGQLI